MTVLTGAAAALLASFFWALGSILAQNPVRHLGILRFTHVQLVSSFAVLACIVSLSVGWGNIGSNHLANILFASAIGVVLGNFSFAYCIRVLGPRLTHLIMMTASPIAVVLDFIVFKKLPLVRQIEGGLIIMIGIAIAIAYGESSKKIHEPQKNKQRIIGFGVGLVAASSQVCGLLALKPLLQEGVAPLAVTAVRTGGGALLVSLIFVLMASKLKDAYDVNHKVIVSAITPGIMGYCVAVSLQLYALRNLGAGAAILLGSTAPIMVVPLLWIHSRQRQAVGAWIGAGVAISGIAWAII